MANEKRLIDLSTLGIGERNPNAFNDPQRAYGWNDLLKILESAPTVDAVPVEQQYYMGVLINMFRCSLCESQADTKHKYCPNCGAKIDGD